MFGSVGVQFGYWDGCGLLVEGCGVGYGLLLEVFVGYFDVYRGGFQCVFQFCF